MLVYTVDAVCIHIAPLLCTSSSHSLLGLPGPFITQNITALICLLSPFILHTGLKKFSFISFTLWKKYINCHAELTTYFGVGNFCVQWMFNNCRLSTTLLPLQTFVPFLTRSMFFFLFFKLKSSSLFARCACHAVPLLSGVAFVRWYSLPIRIASFCW